MKYNLKSKTFKPLITRMTKIFLASSLTCSLTMSQAQDSTRIVSADIRVMTYNLRFASDQEPDRWSGRRPLMDSLLTKYQPDIIGTQEGLYNQLSDLTKDLKTYNWIGLGREGGSRGEFCAVFYNQRFEPLAFDHFWLSGTSDRIGSKTWGNDLPRMVTWILFLDRKTGCRFYLFNTHFDHQSESAREKSATLLRKRIAQLDTTLPVILIGDFNAAAGRSQPYEILLRDGMFTDAWTSAVERIGEGINTLNSFAARPTQNGERIDWILYKGNVHINRIEIITDQFNGHFPSDHFPVMAHIVFEKK
jgi:endonuclease/exonuclease/phosphatase family metal-dependent hydrolase